jgi:malate dehydrogenase (quinone)
VVGFSGPPQEFINPVAHLSFVHGADMVEFLRKRYEGMAAHHFFQGIEYTTDHETIRSWAPLLVEGRGDTPNCGGRTKSSHDFLVLRNGNRTNRKTEAAELLDTSFH